MKNTFVRRLVPVDFLDLDGLELWLEEMAAKGLHFQGFGGVRRPRSATTPSPPRTSGGT